MTRIDLAELTDKRTRLAVLTVDEYHELISMGIVPEGEPYELLDGVVIRTDRSKAGEDPRTISAEHASVVAKLGKLKSKLAREGCTMRIEQPIRLPECNEPVPDGAIVRGKNDAYLERHPGPHDVLCVIEVADSSLRRDRVPKLRIYADSGLPHYVIINLPDRMIEVYTDPLVGKGRYGQAMTLKAGQCVGFPTASGEKVSVNPQRLLP